MHIALYELYNIFVSIEFVYSIYIYTHIQFMYIYTKRSLPIVFFIVHKTLPYIFKYAPLLVLPVMLCKKG